MGNLTDAVRAQSGHTWLMSPAAFVRRLLRRRPRHRMDELTAADRRRIAGAGLTMREQLERLTEPKGEA